MKVTLLTLHSSQQHYKKVSICILMSFSTEFYYQGLHSTITVEDGHGQLLDAKKAETIYTLMTRLSMLQNMSSLCDIEDEIPCIMVQSIW